MAETLAIWTELETTDPTFAKNFNRSGFKGTMIDPCYGSKKLTELFGPRGTGWRFVAGKRATNANREKR